MMLKNKIGGVLLLLLILFTLSVVIFPLVFAVAEQMSGSGFSDIATLVAIMTAMMPVSYGLSFVVEIPVALAFILMLGDGTK